MMSLIGRMAGWILAAIAAVIVASGGDIGAGMTTGTKITTTVADTAAVGSVVGPDMFSRFFDTRATLQQQAPAPAPAAPQGNPAPAVVAP